MSTNEITTTETTHHGRPSKYTPEQIENLKSALAGGATLAAAATQVGMTTVAARYYKAKFSGAVVQSRAKGTRTTDRTDPLLVLESTVLKRLDAEIEKLTERVETDRKRLVEVKSKRSRFTRALGVLAEDTETETETETVAAAPTAPTEASDVIE